MFGDPVGGGGGGVQMVAGFGLFPALFGVHINLTPLIQRAFGATAGPAAPTGRPGVMAQPLTEEQQRAQTNLILSTMMAVFILYLLVL